jgi:hypothetical protein
VLTVELLESKIRCNCGVRHSIQLRVLSYLLVARREFALRDPCVLAKFALHSDEPVIARWAAIDDEGVPCGMVSGECRIASSRGVFEEDLADGDIPELRAEAGEEAGGEVEVQLQRTE